MTSPSRTTLEWTRLFPPTFAPMGNASSGNSTPTFLASLMMNRALRPVRQKKSNRKVRKEDNAVIKKTFTPLNLDTPGIPVLGVSVLYNPLQLP